MTIMLITGADRSFGLETTRGLVEAGHTVDARVRDLDRADDVRCGAAR